MLKYLLDTDIAIYTIKSRPLTVKTAFDAHYGAIGISTISLMELVYGAEKSSNPERNLRDIEGFVARLEVLSYDSKAAIHTGQIRAQLAKIGRPIGPYDQMIAGLARSQGLVLVTNNQREFVRVPGLQIDNWC